MKQVSNMDKEYIKKWLKAALIRALKTFGQSAAAAIGTGAIGITDMDLLGILSIGAGGALLSFLTSLAGLPEVEEESEYPSSQSLMDSLKDLNKEDDISG